MEKKNKITIVIIIVIVLVIGAVAVYFLTKKPVITATNTQADSGISGLLNSGGLGKLIDLFKKDKSNPDLEPQTYHDSEGNTWTI